MARHWSWPQAVNLDLADSRIVAQRRGGPRAAGRWPLAAAARPQAAGRGLPGAVRGPQAASQERGSRNRGHRPQAAGRRL